jgi:hypothetical protein
LAEWCQCSTVANKNTSSQNAEASKEVKTPQRLRIGIFDDPHAIAPSRGQKPTVAMSLLKTSQASSDRKRYSWKRIRTGTFANFRIGQKVLLCL